MIPQGSRQNCPLIVDLADQEITGNIGAARWIICTPILFPAQQHVAGNRTFNTGKESPVFVQVRYTLPFLDTVSHQGGGQRYPTNTHNAIDHVQWKACQHFPVKADNQILTILSQPRTFLADIDGVEIGTHGLPPFICSRNTRLQLFFNPLPHGWAP